MVTLSYSGQTIELPNSIVDLELEQFCDAWGFIAEYITEDVKEEPNEAKLVELMVKVFSFLRPDIDWSEVPIFNAEFRDTFRELIDFFYTTAKNYIPQADAKGCSFSIDGKTYYLNGVSGGLAAGVHKPINALEAIEFLEFDKRYKEAVSSIEKTSPESLPFMLANAEFTFRAATLAMIYRRKNEKLPLDETERAAFLIERANLFKKAPAKIAFDTCFFLRAKQKALLKSTQPFSTQRKSSRKTANLKALPKRKGNVQAGTGLS